MGSKLSHFKSEYFLKYLLPLLITIATVSASVSFSLSSRLTKIESNIQLLTNALNESVIPLLEEISGQKIAKIKSVAQNTMRQSFADSLYRQQQQLANRIDSITLVAKNGSDKTIEENIRPVLPGIYSFLAKWHDEQGNAAEALVALNAYFHYYSANKHLTPPSATNAMMQDLERKYRQTARKE